MEQPSGPQIASAQARWVGPDAAPPALDDDDDVIDAEIADVPAVSADLPVPAVDYSEAGVPSLDYLREKIEGRYGESIGSVELAQEAADREALSRRQSSEQAAQIAAERRAALDQAATDKLAEVRRSLRP